MEDSIEFKGGAVTLEGHAERTNEGDDLRASYLAFEDKLQQMMKDTMTSNFKEANLMTQTMMTDLKMPTQANFSKFRQFDEE